MHEEGHKAHKEMTENEIANKIIGIAIEVHKALGLGLLESVYKDVCITKLAIQVCMLRKKSQCL